MFLLTFATYEVVDHLEEQQTAALICLLCIVFLGYGGCGIVGGALLIKRCCMDDPRDRLYHVAAFNNSFEGNGSDGLHDFTQQLNHLGQPLIASPGQPGYISQAMHQKMLNNKRLAARYARMYMVRPTLPDFYPHVHLGKNFKHKDKFQTASEIYKEINRLDSLIIKMDYKRQKQCETDNCKREHIKSNLALNMLENGLDQNGKSKGLDENSNLLF